MRSYLFRIVLLIIPALFSACAGVSIKPISAIDDKGNPIDLHKTLAKAGTNGYVVFHPKVVMEVTEKEYCFSHNEKGECISTGTLCNVGSRFVVPDYSKPYLITVQSGLGKAGVDLTFTDGWLLSAVKDNSDNTALVEVLLKAVSGGYKVATKGQRQYCDQTGLWMWDGQTFTRIHTKEN